MYECRSFVNVFAAVVKTKENVVDESQEGTTYKHTVFTMNKRNQIHESVSLTNLSFVRSLSRNSCHGRIILLEYVFVVVKTNNKYRCCTP